MLTSLSIRDFILIDQLTLAVPKGLTVLTGETGAGKSILLDALGLVLGGRSGGGAVRPGAEQAVVSAVFELAPGHPAAALLAEQGLGAEEALFLRRSLSPDGRSRAFVNDQPASVGLLKQLGALLVEVHGQFDTHGLLDPGEHRGVLDAYGQLGPLTGATRETHRALDQARAALAALTEAQAKAAADEDYLRHALAELDQAAPQPGEEAELAAQRQRLAGRERLLEAVAGALKEIVGDRGARKATGQARRQLERAAEKSLPEIQERLDAIIGALDRADQELAEAEDMAESLFQDEEGDGPRLDQVEERLFALRALARKHGVAVETLPDLRRQLAERLALIEDNSIRLTAAAAALETARTAYRAAATALSDARAASATALDAAVTGELVPLKLDRARFSTRIEALAEDDWGPNGRDRITFLVATNPGLPPGPLNKIASGGELARFMLALKVVLAKSISADTLIFDEVDAGVGGAVAAAVGDRLAALSADAQVLVVTHSPQVAARAANHWKIAKSVSDDGRTRTQVTPLAAEARREEIARMLAGAEVTEEARAAAGRLIGV